MTAPRLNIIGAGRLGRTLGRLWREAGALQIGGVCNRSEASAREAVKFIGAGEVVAAPNRLPSAELTLIATPDGQIAETAELLAASGMLRRGDVVFHASGALSSTLLEALRAPGGAIASVHPIRAFADPASAAAAFAPTFCGAEGDEAALALLEPLFAAIGGECLRIDPARKALYHAAAVMASNYLVALVDLSLETYAAAGLDREDARRLLAPILSGTLDNIIRVDTTAALTGPIARGDVATVAAQLKALDGWHGDVADAYRTLGRQALKLAEQAGESDPDGLAQIGQLLQANTGD